jgi:hypothetical protein
MRKTAAPSHSKRGRVLNEAWMRIQTIGTLAMGVTVGGFAHNPGVESLAHPALRGGLLSACGALAGMVMLTTYTQYLLPGALIALRVIESAALVGAALIAGEPALAYGALGRGCWWCG